MDSPLFTGDLPWSTPTQALMVECLDGFVWSFLGPIIPIIPILALSCKNDTYIECYTPKSLFFLEKQNLENDSENPKISVYVGKSWKIIAI